MIEPNEFVREKYDDFRKILLLEDVVVADYAHFHNSLELIYVEEGSVRATINGREYVANEGDMLIVNCFDIHCYQKLSEKLRVYILVMDHEYLVYYEQAFKGFRFGHLSTDRAVNSAVKEIFLKWYDEGITVLNSYGYVNLIADLLTRRLPMCRKEAERNDFVELIEYINNNYTQDLTLCDVAKTFGYSSAVLSTKFNKIMGAGFKHYLNRIRLKKLQQLKAENPKEKLNVLLYKVGFANPAMYYRAIARERENN